MPKKKLTEQQKREIEMLRSNSIMYDRTLDEVKNRAGSENVVKQIMEAKSDIDIKLKQLGVDDVYVAENSDPLDLIVNDEVTEPKVKIYRPEDTIIDTVEESDAKPSVSIVDEDREETNVVGEEALVDNDHVQYDVIPLPSNGECYPSKIARLPVSYLTAYDENMIMSPNLYRDGLIIDYLLKNKILSKDIDPDDLVSGDVDAITLFLRATSYGTDYPISVLDNLTGERIETTLDLSTLKLKEIKIKGDENGHFSYTLPHSKREVKFKYLTRREEKTLDKLSNIESEQIRAEELRGVVKTINAALKIDKTLDKRERQEIASSAKWLGSWIEKLEKETKTMPYSMSITNRLEMQVTAIDGNYDRKYIHDAIINMPARDSIELRKYILDNEPGVDFNITVERPESLGGGSINTFLNWEDTVFLNIA